MTEREKVIKGLEEVIAEAVYPDRPRKFMMLLELAEDALALLKAQEPVEPYTKRDGRTTFFLCGGCNKPLCIAKDSYKPKRCPECGREVKWE